MLSKTDDSKPVDEKPLENVDIDWKELMNQYEPSRITSQQSGSADRLILMPL